MQSTGQTVMHASQPVHMSSSSRAKTLGSFFFAIAVIDCRDHRPVSPMTLLELCLPTADKVA
jgi:hypothetical protein